MSRRRDPKGDDARLERREALLDAATTVIRRDGPGASMDAMASEAGISKPILYRHFGDRQGLVEALAHRFAGALRDELATALADGDSPRQVLIGTVDAYLAFVERDPDLYRFVVQQMGDGAAATLGDFVRQVGQQVAFVLGEQLRAAGLDSGGAEPIAHGIVGMVHAAGDWWVDRRSMPRARLVQYLTDLLWDGIGRIDLSAATDRPALVIAPIDRRSAR